MYGYLLLISLIFLMTGVFSFTGREKFVRKWIFVLPTLLVAGSFFILWEHYFIVWKIWSFNPEYISGIYIFQLPAEEILSIISLPIAFIFIFEKLNSKYPGAGIGYRKSIALSWLMVLIFTGIAWIFKEKVYTAIVSVLCLFLLLQHLLIYRRKYYGKYYRAFLVCLLPLLIIRSILTSLPVITCDPEQIIGFSIFNMPAEDILYLFFMMLLNVSVYEYAKSGRHGAAKAKDNEIPEIEKAELKD